MRRQKLLPWAAAIAIGLGSTSAQATFTIDLDLGGVALEYRSYFDAAKSFWEGVIVGYQPGISLTGVSIEALTATGDGVGGTLGFAGPDGPLVTQGDFKLAGSGVMQFDIADVPGLVNSGSFGDVIRHEMAHVLGFGTLWTDNLVYSDGSGQYTGAAALAQYRIEYNQPGALFVPVELGGGPGTNDGHWNESDGGNSDTGITDTSGSDMRFELMTGWLNSPSYTSRTTAASFQDIGYVVNLSAVPEPAAVALWLLGLPLLAGWAARRRA
jgi:hypothetical protein